MIQLSYLAPSGEELEISLDKRASKGGEETADEMEGRLKGIAMEEPSDHPRGLHHISLTIVSANGNTDCALGLRA